MNEEQQCNIIDCQLSNNEMLGIYQSLSTKENTDFDTVEELQYVEKCIDECFDKDFKVIDYEILQKNAMLLNTKFVDLIKYCKQKNNYKKIGYLFIGFCYYFNLDEVLTYKNFHEKIQNLIKLSAKIICGKTVFNNAENKNRKYKDIQIISLFSLGKK